MLSLPFTGITGFADKGFPGFSGWLTAVFEPTGWAEPLGDKFFWIANLLLWIGWINLYAGLFNCLPSGPLDGGYIFKEGVDRTLDRKGLLKYSSYVTSAVSYLMLAVLLAVVLLPIVLNA